MLRKAMKLAEHIQKQVSLSLGLAVVCFSLVNPVHAIPFKQINQVYFFGDSLTDSGYNDYFPTPSGKAPTFTTYEGYTWAQYVARDIKGFALTPSAQYPISYPNLANDKVTNNTTSPILSKCPGPACPVSRMLNGIDYAAGGSSTNSTGFGIPWAPSLVSQVSQFLKTHSSVNAKDVVFIWSGANDLLTVFSASSTSPLLELLLLEAANTAAKNIAQQVERLSQHGARRVVVLSLPNIGYTPFVNDLVTVGLAPASLPADMKTITFTFNSMLNQELGRVKAKYGVKILYVDVYDLLDGMIIATKAGKSYQVAGESFYFTNYRSPVCGYQTPLTPGVLPSYVSALVCTMQSNGYIFADSLHPTDMAQRALSLAVEQQIRSWL